jgi:hypothetical protein
MARLIAPELDDVSYLSLSAISPERIAPAPPTPPRLFV